MEYEEALPVSPELLSEILEMSRNLRFGVGDLLTVRENFKMIKAGLTGYGPTIRGYSRVRADRLAPGASFLALGPATPAPRKDNRRLYVEIMTAEGPKLCWASAFKMKKQESEDA